MQRTILWAMVLAIFVLGGCASQQMIANTKIPDTQENREVLKVVEAYRRALEREDAPRLLLLAHPTYDDNGGTPEPEDDIDYEGLARLLRERFKRAERIRYRIEYRDLTFKGREAWVDVWIDATFIYQQADTLSRYRRFTDFQRYVLLKTNKGWRFIRGL